MTDGVQQLPVPTDDERLEAIISFEGSYQAIEKLALETLARTGRDPMFCFELAIAMERIRMKIFQERRKRTATAVTPPIS